MNETYYKVEYKRNDEHWESYIYTSLNNAHTLAHLLVDEVPTITVVMIYQCDGSGHEKKIWQSK